MPGFGSLAPASDDDDLINRYYDPGTGLPVGGTDKYAPPRPRQPLYPADIGGALPEAYGAGQPIRDPLVTMARKTLWDVPRGLVGMARTTPYGLRREDVTDIPADYTPDPTSPTRGYLPRVPWQPIDPLVGQSVGVASGVLGAPAVGPVEAGAGEAVFGAGAIRRRIANETLKKAAGETVSPAAAEEAPQPPPVIRQQAPTAGVSGIVNAGVEAPPNPRIQTVSQPYRMMFPGIYGNPRTIAAEAAARVGPEDPAMKQLFGVTRGDLWEMAQDRRGNVLPPIPEAGPRARGSEAGRRIMTPENTQRLVDILSEAGQHEGLRNADAWYIMDPVHARMQQMFGPVEANPRYSHFNIMTGMASPGSDVMTELQRGTAAHWLEQQGRFEDFMRYAGVPEEERGAGFFPEDMMYIGGHPYHGTSQAIPMQKYLAAGRAIQSKEPKVPLYTSASGVPETGFQTQGPVGDAHWSRGVGLTDVRKGPTDVQGSFSTPEYQTVQPWWQHKVAEPVGLESVPAQARLWTVLGPQTGVESALGAPKLELLSSQIMKAASRLGISPERARDLILSGGAGAGVLAGTVGAGAGFGSLVPQGEQRQ